MIAPRPRPGLAPSVTLPLGYMLTAVAAFLAAAVGVPWLSGELAGHYYHPRVVALTHTVTLGWITLTIMGATFQLIPIVLERPIWSQRLARWQYPILVSGIIGLVAHFYLGQRSGIAWAAGLVGAGGAAYLVNVLATLRGLQRFTFTARLMLGAFAGLALTLGFGLGLAADRVWPFLPGDFLATLHAHFHLAVLGWVAPMVIGVAARVYPMFLLAAEPAGWSASLQLWGLAAGVPALVIGLLAAPPLVAPGAVAVATAFAAHAAWVAAVLRARKRPALDWGLRFVLTATVFLLVATASGLGFAFDVLGGPRAGLAYAVIALAGWVSLTIVGMMLKIVPFLVWYRTYAPRVGQAPVPTLGQLAWPAAERIAYAGLTGGTLALAMAVAAGRPGWIRAAGILLAAGALAFAAVLGRVLSHLMGAGRRAPRDALQGITVP
jgi:hypothetical protein